MRRYGLSGTNRSVRPSARRRINKARLGTFIGVTAAAVVAIVLCVNIFGKAEDTPPQPSETLPVQVLDNVFDKGVTVGGVDVSGMTMDQAKTAVMPAADSLLNEGIIEFSVLLPVEGSGHNTGTADGEDGNPHMDEDSTVQNKYSLTLQELGASVDVDTVLTEAMEYRNPVPQETDDGSTEVSLSTGTVNGTGKDFPLERTLDTAVLENKINQLAEENKWTVEPITSTYRPNYYSDENDLTTGGEIVEGEPTDGYRVKTENIITTIETQFDSNQFEPFDAEIEILSGEAAQANSKKPVLMATATTSFDTSPSERRYNIWKISEKLNGVTIKPGVTFSINDHVGDRTVESGWKEANGIENGIYTPQAGGGICQVSSTLYNAALKAELDIVSRVPHTIMASYVKPGLDATISSGGPDFKVENPYDEDIYIIVKCNVPDRKVTVEIWGYEDRDYTVELYSELVSDKDQKKPEPTFQTNSSIGAYEIREVKPGRRYEKYQLYARHLDKETGAVIEENIPVGTSTYADIQGIYEIGTGVPYSPGMTLDEVKAAAAAAAAAAAEPVPDVVPVDPGIEAPPAEEPAAEAPAPEAPAPAEPAPAEPVAEEPAPAAEPAPEAPAAQNSKLFIIY